MRSAVFRGRTDRIGRLKQRVFATLELLASNDRVGRWWGTAIMALIIGNVVAVILETENELLVRYGAVFYWFEAFSVAVFTAEYLLRLWACTAKSGGGNPIKQRIEYALTPLAIIDLIAVLPFYLPLIFPVDLRFLRALRLFRLFRLFKLGRYSDSMRTVGLVMRARKEELTVTVFVAGILLIVASSLLYFIEHEAQPETFSSIPAAMWWGVATLTTVGYGDIYPVTSLGRIVGGMIAVLGVGLFALPTGILASGFAEEMQRNRRRVQVCPHCGQDVNAPPERQDEG